MPPKTVKCVLCEQEVLKAQTLARKDGTRACRSHPGVEEEATKLREAENARLMNDLNKPKMKPWQETPEHRREREFKFEKDMATWRDYVYNHCWVCERPGVNLREWHLQVLVAMKRLEIRGEFNFFSMPQDVAKMMGGTLALVPLPYDEQQDRRMLHLIKNRKLRDILHFIRQIQLCGECVSKYGFQERFETMMPKPTLDQVMQFLPIMSIAIDPVIKEMAEKKEQEN